MQRLRVLTAILAISTPCWLSPPAAAQLSEGRVAAATADAVRLGQRHPDREATARMKIAEQLMLTDPAAALAMVQAARAASIRAEGKDGPMVALADYRLALIRALGGDRAGQMQAMATAAFRVADGAHTPDHRTLAGQALIVGASFTMSSGEVALTDRLRDAGVAMLSRDDLAQTTDLAEAFRVAADVFEFQNRSANALPWADRAVVLYDRLRSDDASLVYALARRGSALLRLSRFAEALADLRRAVARSDGATDDPTVRVMALRSLGNYYAQMGETDLALPLLKRALVAAERLPPGFPYAAGVSRDIMTTLMDADRPDEARHYAEATATRAQATMGPTSYAYGNALLVLARIDIAQDAFDDAARRIAQADAIFARGVGADNSRRFEPLAARAALLAATGRSADAASHYDRARALIAYLPPDDADRIDLAEGSAAARLATARSSREAWPAARAAADGLTTRIVRQVAGIGAIDAARGRGRTDRVFGTALDVAWMTRR